LSSGREWSEKLNFFVFKADMNRMLRVLPFELKL